MSQLPPTYHDNANGNAASDPAAVTAVKTWSVRVATGKPNKVLEKHLAKWESRFGREAVEEYCQGMNLRGLGGLSAVALWVVFLAAMVLKIKVVAVAAMILMFGGAIPAVGIGSWKLIHFIRMVVARYGLPKSARKSFPIRGINSRQGPERFDAWLASQQSELRSEASRS